jgi:DNA repair protein RadC
MYKVQKYRVELVRDGVQRFAFDSAPCAQTAAAIFHKLIGKLPHEETWALLLNAKLEIIGATRISQGGLFGAAMKPFDVFRPVVSSGAAAFVLGHNHPSGDPRPSAADLEMTEHLIEGAELLGVTLADHLIVVRSGAHVSLRDHLAWGSKS